MSIALRIVSLCLFALAFPLSANAQGLHPFSSVEDILAARGAPANATFRARYEQTENGEASEIVIEAAPDWARVRNGGVNFLYDFELDRLFLLHEGNFGSYPIAANAMFRVSELQNRAFIAGALRAGGAGDDMGDGCDAETELGVVIASLPGAGRIESRTRRGATEILCNDRVIGSFEASDDPAPPRAFWPTLTNITNLHPALRTAMQESRRAPARMEVSFRPMGPEVTRRVWRLVAIEQIDAPYPLAGENRTAELISVQSDADLAQLAHEAVAGRAAGGAPTLESWDAHIRTLDEVNAAMLFGVGVNMFPELIQACPGGAHYAMCETIRRLNATAAREPAVRALLSITMAEQTGDHSAAIQSMRAAQATPLGAHPALGASFALALVGGDGELREQAEAAGLPADPLPLTLAGVRAYPYVPGYWSDLGDLYRANWRFDLAFFCYEVGAALPVPGAASSPASGRLETARRFRADFPHFFR